MGLSLSSKHCHLLIVWASARRPEGEHWEMSSRVSATFTTLSLPAAIRFSFKTSRVGDLCGLMIKWHISSGKALNSKGFESQTLFVLVCI